MFSCLILVGLLSSCCHRKDQQVNVFGREVSRQEHEELMRRVPMYRDVVNGNVPDYKTRAHQLLARVQSKHTANELQDWAIATLEANREREAPFDLEAGSLPDFIANLDSPIKPWVLVFPGSHVTIDWGGGFGHWGLHVGPPRSPPSNPLQYVVEWVPGVYVYSTRD